MIGLWTFVWTYILFGISLIGFFTFVGWQAVKRVKGLGSLNQPNNRIAFDYSFKRSLWARRWIVLIGLAALLQMLALLYPVLTEQALKTLGDANKTAAFLLEIDPTFLWAVLTVVNVYLYFVYAVTYQQVAKTVNTPPFVVQRGFFKMSGMYANVDFGPPLALLPMPAYLLFFLNIEFVARLAG